MSKQNKIILGIIGLFLILMSAGITYAFFTSNTNNESASTIYAKGGTMNITYASGDGNIIMENIYPRETAWVNKSFTVTGNNSTDLDMYYSVSLVCDSTETIEYLPALSYTLTGINTSNNGTTIPNITNPELLGEMTTELGVGKFNKGANVKHTYTLSLYLKDADYSQNALQEQSFAFHLIIGTLNENGTANYSGNGRTIYISEFLNPNITKSFAVNSGKNEANYNYDIYFIPNDESNFSSIDLKYSLTGVGTSGTIANEIDKNFDADYNDYSYKPSSIKLGSGSFNKPNTTHTYTLNLSIIEIMIDSRKLSVKPLIGNSTQAVGKILVEKQQLLANNITSSSTKPKTTPGKDNAITDEGIFQTQDDYGTSYYYRGASENNYASFAGMCWRIVRKTGNNAIKLVLYNNESPDCTISKNKLAFLRTDISDEAEGIIRSSNENASVVGYYYGEQAAIKSPIAFNENNVLLSNKINSEDIISIPETTTSNFKNYSEIFKNTNASPEATKLFQWYEEKLSEYSPYIEDVIWCNDKKYNVDTGKFAGFERYVSSSPSLICQDDSLGGKLSKYTTTDITKGNGVLSYPIGLLTADELMFAGAGQSENKNFYLYQNTGDYWLTMTPSLQSGAYYGSFNYNTKLKDGSSGKVPTLYLRPSIALKSNVKAIGSGTKNNPYIIIGI